MKWNPTTTRPEAIACMQRCLEEFAIEPIKTGIDMYMGTGGSIPFMGMLGERFPEAQFLITGLLGPKSNAHGPNEFLHIDTGKKLTSCVARVLEDHGYARGFVGKYHVGTHIDEQNEHDPRHNVAV